jgi:chromosomal replication initiator protein
VPKHSSSSLERNVIKETANDSPGEVSVQTDLEPALKIWKKFIDLLSDNLKASEINTWFSVISPKSLEGEVLTVMVPSEDYYSLIESRYNNVIASIVESLLGKEGKLKYEIMQMGLFDGQAEDETPVNNPKIMPISSRKTLPELSSVTEISEQDDFVTNLNQKHIFDNFIKGESNELAVAAAYAITNNPGHTYNPFFVYGGVGLGKTHIIQAIGNEVLKKFPDKKVYYTTAPDFTTQFTNNIAQSRIDFSQNKNGPKKLDFFYKSLDVLIIDDIQYLSGKEKTQDFMYQIFNTLYDQKKHVIFSSDKPVSQIKGIEERLISRFQWGITADIQPPNWEMRVAIIQQKFEEAKMEVPEEVVHFIASNVKDSIRTIEGCIVGIIADSVLRFKGEINLTIADNVISRVVGTARKSRNVSIENIIYTVANYYKISENQILSRKRTKEVAFARQVAMYLAKDLTNLTLETIGLNFGGKDHATVLYSYNTITAGAKKDSSVAHQIEEIKELLRNL